MLNVVTNTTKSDFCENIFLLFYKPNRSILRDQIVDLFDIFSRIYINRHLFYPTLLSKQYSKHEKQIKSKQPSSLCFKLEFLAQNCLLERFSMLWLLKCFYYGPLDGSQGPYSSWFVGSKSGTIFFIV